MQHIWSTTRLDVIHVSWACTAHMLKLLLHNSISILTELLLLVVYWTEVALFHLCLAHFAPLHVLLLLREVAQTTGTSHMHELLHLLLLLLLILLLFLVLLLL